MAKQSVDINTIWRRIVEYEGKTFKQKQGQEFCYAIKGNAIVPSTTNRMIPYTSFQKALDFVPLQNVSVIRTICQGPSYVYAILMDQRIRSGLW